MTVNVIVIGRVTEKQYNKARLKLLGDGKRPKIVRVSPEDFFLFSKHEYDPDHMLLDRYATAKEKALMDKPLEENGNAESGEEEARILEKCCNKHMKRFSPIGAVVMSAEDHKRLENSHGAIVDELTTNLTFDVWIVQKNGEVTFYC